ncbi:MAG: organic solvent ABC transporter substrate-binding protein [Bdellovibrionaceae bacterium]|nr:organic solvent ABC transporter substrate-binding protein [Pseudobdellovibrionaceae bacterium]
MKSEVKVGLLFFASILAVITFVYYLGLINPFASEKRLTVVYSFAGGIEVGSPVRVMGIKVGKVKEITFDPLTRVAEGEDPENKLRVVITVSDDAWNSIREDSKFYINLAGVIGEKFLEVSPGSAEAPALKNGQIVRGEDPPRIDQLISQSYGLAGKILEIVENNKGDVIDTIKLLNKLVRDFDKALTQLDRISKRDDLAQLVDNAVGLTGDLRHFTGKLRTPEGEKTIKLLHELLWRLKELDKAAIKEFLQKEGIKAKLF